MPTMYYTIRADETMVFVWEQSATHSPIGEKPTTSCRMKIHFNEHKKVIQILGLPKSPPYHCIWYLWQQGLVQLLRRPLLLDQRPCLKTAGWIRIFGSSNYQNYIYTKFGQRSDISVSNMKHGSLRYKPQLIRNECTISSEQTYLIIVRSEGASLRIVLILRFIRLTYHERCLIWLLDIPYCKFEKVIWISSWFWSVIHPNNRSIQRS